VTYEDDDTFQDVLNDLWSALWADPNDEVEHGMAPWVRECCERHRTVADLKRADQWKDLYIAIRPRKIGTGGMLDRSGADGQPWDRLLNWQMEVTQITYDTLLIEVQVPGQGNNEGGDVPLDLMFLLRS
jgi:hypothetical protein